MAVKKGASFEEEQGRCQVRLVEFGSYMLNVHFPGTDIDVICVFRQKFVSRQEFFDGFVKHVKQRPNFCNLSIIQQARVPIIKFMLNRVQFDVLFAAVEEPQKVFKMLK